MRQFGLIGALVVVVAALALIVRGTPRSSAPASPSASAPAATPTPPPAEVPTDRRGASGRPLPEGTPVREAGWAPSPHRDARHDADAWVSERAEAHADWVENTAVALDIYADRRQLSDVQFAALSASIQALQDEVGEVRRQVESGELGPADAREAISAARAACTAELSELLGEQEADNFRLEMIKRVPGGVI